MDIQKLEASFLNITLEGVCWKQTKGNNLTVSRPKNTHSQWGEFFLFLFNKNVS